MFNDYYRLAKPGIVYGNLITTIAAFLFALGWEVPPVLVPIAIEVFLATVVGLGLVIASACVFNNYLDRGIDRKMERTKNRALVTGAISPRSALIYGAVLGLAGLALLVAFVNFLAAAIALFGWFSYVVLYGYAKRAGWWGVLVGSIPGAVPIVVGYTAVTNQFDLNALILFLILVAWQMPHFFGIALYRNDEYAAASIPTLPVQKGALVTKFYTVAFVILFLIATALLAVFGFAGYVYFAIMLVLSIVWLWQSVAGFRKGTDDKKWAQGIFRFSLIILLVFSVTLAVAPLLP